MSKESFHPKNYKSYEELPEKEKGNFKKVEGGFVRHHAETDVANAHKEALQDIKQYYEKKAEFKKNLKKIIASLEESGNGKISWLRGLELLASNADKLIPGDAIQVAETMDEHSTLGKKIKEFSGREEHMACCVFDAIEGSKRNEKVRDLVETSSRNLKDSFVPNLFQFLSEHKPELIIKTNRNESIFLRSEAGIFQLTAKKEGEKMRYDYERLYKDNQEENSKLKSILSSAPVDPATFALFSHDPVSYLGPKI